MNSNSQMMWHFAGLSLFISSMVTSPLQGMQLTVPCAQHNAHFLCLVTRGGQESQWDVFKVYPHEFYTRYPGILVRESGSAVGMDFVRAIPYVSPEEIAATRACL